MKGNMYRTYNCSELREENVGEEIKLAGWVDTIRDLGGVLCRYAKPIWIR